MIPIKFNKRLTTEQDIELYPAIKKQDSYLNLLSNFKDSKGQLCTKSHLKDWCENPKLINQILLMLILEKEIDRYYLRLTKDSTFYSFYVYGDVNPLHYEQQIIGFDVFTCSQEHLYEFLKQHPKEGFTLKDLRGFGFKGAVWSKLKKLWNRGFILREKDIIENRPQHRYSYYSFEDIKNEIRASAENMFEE